MEVAGGGGGLTFHTTLYKSINNVVIEYTKDMGQLSVSLNFIFPYIYSVFPCLFPHSISNSQIYLFEKIAEKYCRGHS